MRSLFLHFCSATVRDGASDLPDALRGVLLLVYCQRFFVDPILDPQGG